MPNSSGEVPQTSAAGLAEDYEDQEDLLLGPEHACPGCGEYYALTITAPPMPFHLAEYGTDEEQDAWERDNNHNISHCTVCGWRSDED